MPIMETRGGVAYVAIRAHFDHSFADKIALAIQGDLSEKPAIESVKVFKFKDLTCPDHVKSHVHREIARLSKNFKYETRIIKVYLKPEVEHVFAGCKINLWIECRTRKFRKAHDGCCAAAELIAFTGGVDNPKQAMHPQLFE